MLPVLLAPLVTIAEHIAVGVALDRVAKFRKDTNWTQVKIDADKKVRGIVPGEAADDTVVRAVNQVIDKIQSALGETSEMEKLLDQLAAGKWSEAAAELMAHATAGAKVAA